MLTHLIGMGMIFTTLFAGWILNGQYKRAADWKSKSLILKSLRPIGLLSPFSTLVMLASGIANMQIIGYGWFTASWLSTKVVFFVLAAVSGIFFGTKAARRGRLVHRMAEGTAAEGTEKTITAMDKQQRIFFVFQTVLILVILTLSIVKPHA